MPSRRTAVALFAVPALVGLAGCSTAMPVAAPAPREYRVAEFDIEELDAALLALGESLSDADDFVPEFLDVPDADSTLDRGVDTAQFRDPGIGIGHAELALMFSHSHALVERWIDYFTGRGRDQYARFLERKNIYGPALRAWLREEGVPEDLIWLAFIESGVNPLAYSRARAAGIWQFIPATGRRYGLRYDFWTDDRRDPEQATRAAARHLKDLFEAYGSWELAFSAYNAGPRRVDRAMRVAGHRDYWRMVHRSNVLPRETRHYVPKMVAAWRIGQNPAAFGFSVTSAPDPVFWRTIPLPSQVALADVAAQVGLKEADLKLLNLHLRRGLTSPDGHSSFVNVPVEHAPAIEAWIAAGDVPRRKFGGVHTVRAGESLSVIAHAYGTSISELRALNKISARAILRIGQKLVVPTSGRSTRPSAQSSRAPIRTATVTVRGGDTLGLIAMRAGTTVKEIKSLNGLQSDRIVVGQTLRVKSAAATETNASDDVRTYRVRSGDTLWRIAQRHQVPVETLRTLNGLSGNTIRIGDTLKIPLRQPS
jgi:membrane-bound lytic murein transglycosylase D